MKQTFKIDSDEQRDRAMLAVEMLAYSPVWEVLIRPYKKDRSLLQNSLLWKWYGVIAEVWGVPAEEVHEHYKDKFLVRIYERDIDDHPHYAPMIQTLRRMWEDGLKNDAMSLRKHIIALTTTTKATMKEMAEYLTLIEHDALTEHNIYLPTRDDLYYEAMGLKREKPK